MIRYSNKDPKPDAHETKLMVAPCWEPDEYTTCTKDDYLPANALHAHKEPAMGVR